MEKNENVEMITGDPKKAINKLSIPIIASMLLIFANNIIDSIWVAGLGADSLAAVGYITPLFMVLLGVGNGIGAGGNSLISRYIGAEDRESANNAAIHNLILGVIISVVITVIFLIILDPLLKIMGAGAVLDYANAYGTVLFLFSFAMLLPPIIGGAFRSEGDIGKASIPLALSAIINMCIDPVFIYMLNLGVAGAAWATVIANFISLLLMFYWMFIKKDGYLIYSRQHFHNKLSMYKDILVVGIPASLEQLILSVLTIIINLMLTMAGGTVAVAVYTAGWRVINFGMLPAMGIGTSAISVAGVAYGARKYENIRVTARYSLKMGLLFSLIICIVIFIFANQISVIFSYSDSSADLAPLIVTFLQIMNFFILVAPLGMTASCIFQGVGKGTTSFLLTTFREFVLVLSCAYLLGFVFNMGEIGIYCGMIIGAGIGSIICYSVVELYISKLINGSKNAV